MKRFAVDVSQQGSVVESPAGDFVLYADANAEAADLSEDLHLREERILVLSHDIEGCRADLALANARVTALETLLERTLSAWESYQSTRGE